MPCVHTRTRCPPSPLQVLPVAALRQGYRSVGLRSAKGLRLQLAAVLLHIRKSSSEGGTSGDTAASGRGACRRVAFAHTGDVREEELVCSQQKAGSLKSAQL